MPWSNEDNKGASEPRILPVMLTHMALEYLLVRQSFHIPMQ